MQPSTHLSADTQATLLLCGRFGERGGKAARPLTVTEYNRVARALMGCRRRPADLLAGLPAEVMAVGLEPARLEALLARGAALALAMDRWNALGIGVTGRGDALYPARLRGRLRSAASPVLYGAGDWTLLDKDLLCVVGSRDASAPGIAFARKLGRSCAALDVGVVSGGARGVDREAMLAAIDAGGFAVGVLAEALSRAVTSPAYRAAIRERRTVLLSPFPPEAKFTVGQAMDRNKYLYALSSAAIVAASGLSGGTWSGAVENQRNGWVPGFVRVGVETDAGNAGLLEKGLTPLTDGDLDSPESLRRLLVQSPQEAMSTVANQARFGFEAPIASI